MFTIPPGIYENLLAPIMAAQIFMVVLIYVLLVRKRIAINYQLYVCFLLSFIVFLVGRALQEFTDSVTGEKILYARMSLLFSLGVPSLLVAAAKQSGLRLQKLLYVVPYVAGILISVLYVAVMDAGKSALLFTPEMMAPLGIPCTVQSGRIIVLIGALVGLVLPSACLILNELFGRRNRTLLSFFSGSLLFGSLMMLGMSPNYTVGVYYVGSMVSACCWAWAVFADLRDMKGKAWLLKEELRYVALSGRAQSSAEIERLLNSLEELSDGDLGMYKLRIREILSSLIDASVAAGGEVDALLERHKAQSDAIEGSSDSMQIRQIVQTEASELSALIADIPSQQASVVAERTKAYLEGHYCEEISVETVAEHLELSRAHLMREFKKATGQTVNQYLTALRMDRAKELLVAKSVTDTAFEVGYNNSNYFSTVFKKHEGLTPAAYKKQVSGVG
ncbi:helix-turn-helix transcriptional regulator [Coraliomargarita akajimensis]|uniref:Transcriptional regulator, AraC family n=1 Tax=Coraliomargarita akajimensis (strain DSM 45221 / IAM 15411 / JCM 23193 / KCTC 12865 / 04OKA010-24) TaxID=583355 RepID=D5EQ68_CORAD|nr:AraC family transcriptional regulator [Coraliomargarita akajimensis]ADE53836.1 transcriptional regulator, AraC family [Coraliomargarita akajimensis DSM 45221]